MNTIRTAAADTRIGLMLTIISAASFGVIPIFARLAFNAGLNPLQSYSYDFPLLPLCCGQQATNGKVSYNKKSERTKSNIRSRHKR